jgi:guanylate kinase
MSFFKNYSQNGAAQALVVLGAFTVAAEIVRTRKTGKRPYRDYGDGGMNENGSRGIFFGPPSLSEEVNRDEEHQARQQELYQQRLQARRENRASDDDLRKHSTDYMIARNQISRLGRLGDEVSRLMDEEGMTQEEAMGVVAARQQTRHHQMGHHHDESGSRGIFFGPPSLSEEVNRDEEHQARQQKLYQQRLQARREIRASGDDLRKHSTDYMMARDQISRLGRRLDDEVSRLMDEEGMTQEEAMGVVAARQQARHRRS